MKLLRTCLVAVGILCAATAFAQQSADEQAVWKLEHSYWEYVRAQDIVSYKALWHENFLGWPTYSAQAVRKDHITDWLTTYANRGSHLKSYSFHSTASQSTGNLVVVHYKIAMVWADSSEEHSEKLRVTHTWLRGDQGWQIISGMSAGEPQDQR